MILNNVEVLKMKVRPHILDCVVKLKAKNVMALDRSFMKVGVKMC